MSDTTKPLWISSSPPKSKLADSEETPLVSHKQYDSYQQSNDTGSSNWGNPSEPTWMKQKEIDYKKVIITVKMLVTLFVSILFYSISCFFMLWPVS